MQVAVVFTPEERLEHIGLQAADERHAGGCHPRGVGENIYCQSHDKAERHDCRLRRAATEAEHEEGIYEGRSHIKEMDAAEEQRLEERKDEYV